MTYETCKDCEDYEMESEEYKRKIQELENSIYFLESERDNMKNAIEKVYWTVRDLA